MNRFYRHTGLVMSLIGVLHVTTGLIAFRQSFSQMVATGLLNTAQDPVEHRLAFWFTFAGLLMGLVAYLMDWIVRRQSLRLPVAFGYGLTGLCSVGILLSPRSGFWLVLLLGMYLIIAGRRRN